MQKSPLLPVWAERLKNSETGRGLVIKFWITLRKQAELFALFVPWWGYTGLLSTTEGTF